LQTVPEEILVPGPIEIRVTGSRISPIAPVGWELRGDSDKPLLHVWAETATSAIRLPLVYLVAPALRIAIPDDKCRRMASVIG